MNVREPQLPFSIDADPPLEIADDPVAASEWRRVVPLLQRAQAITDGDRGSLLALCQQWSRYLDANARVAGSGMVVRARSGYPMPNPYIGIANKALANCKMLWVELGLTPSSRSRVMTLPPGVGAADDFAEFDDAALTH